VDVERLTQNDRVCAIAAAALAHDFNDELTFILSGVGDAMLAMEPGHPARRPLADAETSARRCAAKCADVLEFSARRGIRPPRAPLSVFLEAA
jgi:hypothetical protein